nr:MAG TPA: hypothetical protein [Caudoviricetes sp.]DAQ70573.1 MAG TPA: hypothetical protein [Bacteriophage sp.]DAY16433.1 MAG TPA: hypothetical protein [Caudoviricetes sp.]
MSTITLAIREKEKGGLRIALPVFYGKGRNK